jgi:redox-sensitive bicupin YhaK (pirin superfamily)
LLVINEDRVAPGAGFGAHGHQDMEILSYVIDGALEHKDSIGNGSVIRPGEIQRMSAGTGIRHSEHNPSQTKGVHFLQIWIAPAQKGLEPSYEQIALPAVTGEAQVDLIAAPAGASGAVSLHQDAQVYRISLNQGAMAALALSPDRYSWVQVATGAAAVNGVFVVAGDGLALSSESNISLAGEATGTQLLIFNLA